jgi:hypothetical protein
MSDDKQTDRHTMKQSQFRLGDDALAELDSLVTAFAAETGDRETRTSVLRKLIHREHVRREKQTKRTS